MKTRPLSRRLRSRRGSALVVALIFSAVIAISITSFLKLTLNAAKLADRSFYSNGAENLADTGLEQALWALNNNNNWTSAGFVARSGYANQYQATYPSTSTSYTFSQGVTGKVRVWIDVASANPHAVAKATVTLADGSTIVKITEAYMRRRSFFNNGLVARRTLRFVGNVMVDSWASDPDNNVGTPAEAYSPSVDKDGGRIASLSVEVDSISVGNADVYGYAAVGSSDLSGIDVGSTGRVGPYGTANGNIDVSRVTFDFTTNFPDVSAPATTSVSNPRTIAAINGSKSLPVALADKSADGKYYYYVPSITLTGNGETLSISTALDPTADVVIIVTDPTGTVVRMTGNNSGINIATNTKLTMYTAGDVSITGNGILNGTATVPSAPSTFQLYGTRSAAEVAVSGMQAIGIKGNGYLSGVAYAPNGDVQISGNGESFGAMIANSVKMNGNGAFHYDESLANLSSVNLWSLSKWRELTTASDRATYTAQLSF